MTDKKVYCVGGMVMEEGEEKAATFVEQPAESGLPSIEQVREMNTMQMIVLSTYKMPRERSVKTSLNVVRVGGPYDGQRESVYATIVEITDERVKGYLPSKVWCDDGEFNILFYVNKSLPKAVRPFKDKMYLMCGVTASPNYVIEYDVNIRLFIDQVTTKDYGTMYVFMFGDESYNHIAMKNKEVVL